jgi:ubiquinone/menaquinone biosynthesis C-methylase UbiE
MGMEGLFARWYDQNVRKYPEQYRTWAKMVAENAAKGSSVLEVASGPGYLAIELAKCVTYAVVGLDISRTLVEIAQKNATKAGVGAAVEFLQGDAAHMPFDDEMFDFIICTAAFRSFANPVGALREMYRVLKAHGRAVIVDMRRDASDEAIRDFVKSIGLSRMDSLMTKWIFKELRQTAYTGDQFRDFISETTFRRYDIRGAKDLIRFEIWLEK